MILALRMSWGTLPSLQHRHRSSWSGSSSAGLPHLITSGGNAVLIKGFSTPQGVDGFSELLQSGLGVQLFKNRQVFNAAKRLLGDRVLCGVDVKDNVRPTDSSVCPCLWWHLQSWTWVAPTSSLAFLLPVWCPHTWAWCHRTRRPFGCCLTAGASSCWCSGVRFVGPVCGRLSALGGSADWGCSCTWLAQHA